MAYFCCGCDCSLRLLSGRKRTTMVMVCQAPPAERCTCRAPPAPLLPARSRACRVLCATATVVKPKLCYVGVRAAGMSFASLGIHIGFSCVGCSLDELAKAAEYLKLVAALHALFSITEPLSPGQDLLSRMLPDALSSVITLQTVPSAVVLLPGWLMLAYMRRSRNSARFRGHQQRARQRLGPSGSGGAAAAAHHQVGRGVCCRGPGVCRGPRDCQLNGAQRSFRAGAACRHAIVCFVPYGEYMQGHKHSACFTWCCAQSRQGPTLSHNVPPGHAHRRYSLVCAQQHTFMLY